MADVGDMRLDHQHIVEAATHAAAQLAVGRPARVYLAPGDLTEYRILAAAPGTEWAYGQVRDGREYWVALCNSFGAGHAWGGEPVTGGYAAEKWTNWGSTSGTREWTGQVIAEFLGALHEAISHLEQQEPRL